MKPSIIPLSIKSSVLSAAFLVFLGPSLLAQTTWNGGSDGTSWNNAANWSSGVPSTTGTARIANTAMPDAPIVLTVGPGSNPFRDLVFAATGNRTVTVNGSPLYLQGDATVSGTLATWSTSGAVAPITINSNIEFGNTVADRAMKFYVNAVSGSITFNGNITPTGTGSRTLQIGGNGVITINGINSTTFMSFGGGGELIAGGTRALGAGGVQKTTNSTLSLRSDVILDSTPGNSYSWLQNSVTSQIRISEVAASTVNRTLTMNSRITGSNGSVMRFVDNINSTGNLILELKYAGGNTQSLLIDTHQSTIVRFAQSGSTTYGAVVTGGGIRDGGIISGNGQVQVTGGGVTTFTEAHTYTGITTLTSGTLKLSGGGSIATTSEIQLASGTRLDVSGITDSSYTFGAAQTIAGTGTIFSGGKNLMVNGTLAPGNSPGTLTFDLGGGSLSLDEEIELVFELGTLSDRVVVNNGSLNIGTGVLDFDNFDFTALSGFGVGDYTLFETSSLIVGTLGAVTSGNIGGYSAELQLVGNDLILSVVPEPSTVALLLGAFGTSALLLRRKRA